LEKAGRYRPLSGRTLEGRRAFDQVDGRRVWLKAYGKLVRRGFGRDCRDRHPRGRQLHGSALILG
jgi:hypothetical protein